MSTRRQFIKIILAAGAFVSVRPLIKANSVVTTGKWRAVVIRRSFFPDLQGAYLDDTDAGPCEKCKIGQEWDFYFPGINPKDMCPKLWNAVCNKLNSELTLEKPCVEVSKGSDGCLVSCGDPTRPVILRLKCLD